MHILGVRPFFRRLVGISILVKYHSLNLLQFPIINSTHHLLPSPHGELAPAIEAILDIYGTEVTVVVSHNGQGLLSLFVISSWDWLNLGLCL
jgi:hypothetical protein